MAHVRQVPRDSGVAYEVRWRADGKFRQRTFTVKREAERFALKVENDITEGAMTAPLVRRVPTVAQVVEASLEASRPGLKERTHRSYVSIYRNRVLPTFGKRKVTEVTRADVQAWVIALTGEGLAPQTVHHCYVALKKAFRYAQDDRLISYNPCGSIRLPKNADTHDFAPVSLTAAEVGKLAQELDDTYGLLVRFAAYTGLRAAEITGLRVRDVNLRAGHVEVRQTHQRLDGEWQEVGTPKSKRSTREVPILDNALLSPLREYLFAHPHRANPDALLWPGQMPGTHIVDYSRVVDVASFRRNCLRPALRALDMPEMRFHDLRHTCASLMLSREVRRKPHEVSRWMGHASLVTTDTIYSHLYIEDYDKDRDAISKRPAAQRQG